MTAVIEDAQRRCEAAAAQLRSYLTRERPARIDAILAKLQDLEARLANEEKVGTFR